MDTTPARPPRKPNRKMPCPKCGNPKEPSAKTCIKCTTPACVLKGVRGPDHPAWKGGISTDRDGYTIRYDPDHPYGARSGGYVREHIRVMELHIGRRITRDEVVHHKDNDILNNDISNLKLMSWSEHSKLHHPRVVLESKPCEFCDQLFSQHEKDGKIEKAGQFKKRRFCSPRCKMKARHLDRSLLTTEQVLTIRSSQLSQSSLAIEYGVSRGTIKAALIGAFPYNIEVSHGGDADAR